MTLPDNANKLAMDNAMLSAGEIWTAVRHAMMRAYTDGRLTCGVVDCASQLQMEPENVMLCILPESAVSNVSIRIQHTLMEAYCRENGIPVVKVETKTAISEMLKQVKAAGKGNNAHARLERKTSNPRDFNCFLVKIPDLVSSEEKMLQKYCESFAHNNEIYVEIPS